MHTDDGYSRHWSVAMSYGIVKMSEQAKGTIETAGLLVFK